MNAEQLEREMRAFAGNPVALGEYIGRIVVERERYRRALEKIASQDYRGPRPHEQTIAWRALHPEEA